MAVSFSESVSNFYKVIWRLFPEGSNFRCGNVSIWHSTDMFANKNVCIFSVRDSNLRKLAERSNDIGPCIFGKCIEIKFVGSVKR
jgi:hypothetical protein